MERKLTFTIRKLSVGVASVCIGATFIGGSVSADQVVAQTAPASDVVQSALTTEQASQSVAQIPSQTDTELVKANSSDMTSSQPKQGVATATQAQAQDQTSLVPEATSFRQAPAVSNQPIQEQLDQAVATYGADQTLQSLPSAEQDTLESALVTSMQTQANQIALKGIVREKTSLSLDDMTKYFMPLVRERRREAQAQGINVNDPSVAAEISRKAQADALIAANANLFSNDTVDVLAGDSSQLLQELLDKGLLTSQNDLTLARLQADLPALYRGVLYLQQQFSFEKDLPSTLVFEPYSLTGKTPDANTAYQRLLAYGSATTADRFLSLRYHATSYQQAQLPYFTGLANSTDLIETLANKAGKPASQYFAEQTQAILATTKSSVYDLLKANRPEVILPILAQGKGIYVGTTDKSVTMGMLASYTDQQDPEQLTAKERGQAQPAKPFFSDILTYQQNYLDFMADVQKNPLPFTTAIDTMNVYDSTKRIGWSAKEGDSAAEAVRRFFAPMGYWRSYTNSQNLGGQSTGNDSMVAFENRFMQKSLSGVGLFTHEMTHSNDESVLFGGVYTKSGRRAGQGPEVYARGLFEAIDNTQGKSEYLPIFNINTAIPIADSTGRIQAQAPHTSKASLERYSKNLMDLVAYLEAKEAEVALKSLTADQKAVYYNRVAQTDQLNLTQADSTRQAGASLISTNDAFVPHGSLGTAKLADPKTVADLVKSDSVSGQFIPRGISPINTNITHNQYDVVPLLDSFYGVQVADSGENTVGDISFKRQAYEILAWQGWDAFITYISHASANDQEAFASILKGAYPDWESFKIAQYDRVSELVPVADLWDEDQLEKDLAAAIQADLQVLTAYRAQVDPILASTPNDSAALTLAANQHNLLANTQAVRTVKQAILSKALAYNDLQAPVLMPDKEGYDIIYVANGATGNGEEATTPMGDLKAAIEKVRDGGIIRLVGNTTYRSPLSIDKALTIDSAQPGYDLILNETLKTNKDLTLRDINLQMITENRVPSKIEASAGNLILDNVSTTVQNQPNLRPRVVLTQANLTVTRSRETILNGIEASGQSEIALLDKTIAVQEGIQATGEVAKLVITNQSNGLSQVLANPTHEVALILDGSHTTDMVLDAIDNLVLKNQATASLDDTKSSNISHLVEITAGSRLQLGKQSLETQILSGDGALALASSSQVRLQELAGNPTVLFSQSDANYYPYDGKVFLEVIDKLNGQPQVILEPISELLTPNAANQWIYQAPYTAYTVYFSFEARDTSLVLPIETLNFLPEDILTQAQQEVTLPSVTATIKDGQGYWRFAGWQTLDGQALTSLTPADKEYLTEIIGKWDYVHSQIPDDYPTVDLPEADLPTITEVPKEAPSYDLPEAELPVVTEIPRDYPTVELPEGKLPEVEVPVISEIPKDYPTVELPEAQVPEITEVPSDYPTVDLPEADIPIITEVPKDYPTVDLPAVNLPVVTEIPKDYPTVELPEAESPVITEVPKDSPTVELPEAQVPEITEIPSDYPTVDLPEAQVPVITEIPSDYPTVDLPEADVPEITEIPKDYPTEDLPEGEVPVITEVPKDSPSYDLPEADVPEITEVPRDYPTVNLPEEEVPEITEIPKDSPTVELPEADIPVITEVPKDYPTVELPAANLPVVTEIPNDYPTVNLPEAQIPVVTQIPNDYPTVDLPEGEIPIITEIPSDYPTVNLPQADLPVISRIPDNYPIVDNLPEAEIPNITQVPNDYPTIDLPAADFPESLKNSANPDKVSAQKTGQVATASKPISDIQPQAQRNLPAVQQHSAERSKESELPNTGDASQSHLTQLILILTWFGLVTSILGRKKDKESKI